VFGMVGVELMKKLIKEMEQDRSIKFLSETKNNRSKLREDRMLIGETFYFIESL
jgi:hypothetical protein